MASKKPKPGDPNFGVGGAPNVGTGGTLVPSTTDVATLAAQSPEAVKNLISSTASGPAPTHDTPPYTEITGSAGPNTGTLNPLAVQSFYAQTVAPLLHQIMTDSSAANDIQSMSGADKTAQYIPKEMQAYFNAQPGRIAGQQKGIDEALAATAASAPALQNLEQQMGGIKSQQLRNYAKILLQGGDITAGVTGP